jgi:hypothetical protein
MKGWENVNRRSMNGRIHAIAYLSGALRTRILRYKYDGDHGWSLIFGRLLLGWLEQHATARPA